MGYELWLTQCKSRYGCAFTPSVGRFTYPGKPDRRDRHCFVSSESHMQREANEIV